MKLHVTQILHINEMKYEFAGVFTRPMKHSTEHNLNRPPNKYSKKHSTQTNVKFLSFIIFIMINLVNANKYQFLINLNYEMVQIDSTINTHIHSLSIHTYILSLQKMNDELPNYI